MSKVKSCSQVMGPGADQGWLFPEHFHAHGSATCTHGGVNRMGHPVSLDWALLRPAHAAPRALPWAVVTWVW